MVRWEDFVHRGFLNKMKTYFINKVIFLILGCLLLMPKMALADSTCESVHLSGAPGNSALDITFVFDGLFPCLTCGFAKSNNYIELEAQIKDFVAYMRATPPFNEMIDSKVNIRYVKTDGINNLSCCNTKFSINDKACNHAKVVDLAAVCPDTDEIVVFSAHGTDDGKDKEKDSRLCSGHEGIGAAGQHAVIYLRPDGSRKVSQLIAHELGHTCAFLADESPDNRDDIGSIFNTFAAANFEDTLQCPAWNAVLGSQCIKIEPAKVIKEGVTTESYRDAENDLMSHGATPGPVDAMVFRSAMERYVSYVKEPISIELHKAAEDFLTKRFKELNPDWLNGDIPADFHTNLFLSDDKDKEKITVITNIVAAELLSDYRGTLTVYTCHDYWIDGAVPKLSIKFKDLSTSHDKGNNRLNANLTADVKFQGHGSLSANGTITYTDILSHIPQTMSCQDLVKVSWDADIPGVNFNAGLNFKNGPLGIIKVEPHINSIGILAKKDVAFNIHIKFSEGVDGLQNLITFIKPIFDVNHFIKSYDYVSLINNQANSFKDQLNKSLEVFGLSLKVSLDAFRVSELVGTGRPLNMFADFYAQDMSPGANLTNGFEIDDNTLRLSGPISFNTPLVSNKDQCVKNYPLIFNADDYSSFNRVIGAVSPQPAIPLASMRIPQMIVNWASASLWNNGFLCAAKEMPIESAPDFLAFLIPGDITIPKIKFNVIATKPPFLDFSTLQDRDGDGKIDLFHDITAEAEVLVNMDIEEVRVSSDGTPLDETRKMNHLVGVGQLFLPFLVEERDIDKPPEEGFSFAKSVLKVDTDKMIVKVKENSFKCTTDGSQKGEVCSSAESFIDTYPILLEPLIKDLLATGINRGLDEVPLNFTRDIDLNFGVIGTDYFSPGVNMNFGQYIARVMARDIVGKWADFDFEFVPKCGPDEYCGLPDPAKIVSVEEVFYKTYTPSLEQNVSFAKCDGVRCKCLNEPTRESAACIHDLMTTEGDLYHYVKVGYYSTDQVSYDFNLHSWNPYKPNVKEKYYVYLAELPTYKHLQDNNFFDEVDSVHRDIHKLTMDATQIVAFRAKTPKGVEQKLKCMAAVILDQSPDMFTYQIRPVLVNVEPHLRSDFNDLYTVCANEDHVDEYHNLIFPDIGYSSSSITGQ